MRRFHIEKQIRIYNGNGYSGFTTKQLELPEPLEFDTLEECEAVLPKLQEFNPVGWNVWDSETGKCVVGEDLFA